MAEKLYEFTIKDLRLRTIIGFNNWEKKDKQDVIITIKYKYNANVAVIDDDVNKAFNYKTITKKIISFVENSKFNLLETLAERIYQIVIQNKELIDVSVSVQKPFALRFCDNVIVNISS